MKSVVASAPSVRCLLTMLLIATAAVRTSNGLLNNADCETHINASVTYYACLADPEHILRPDITAFSVSVDPSNSTCGLTPQRSCTLVRYNIVVLALHSLEQFFTALHHAGRS